MRPDPKDVLFYLARHGTTELNQEDRFRGPLNVALDEKGRQDAQELSNFFDRIKLGGVITSDRNRALETAMAVGDHRDLLPHVEPALRSWNVGYMAGQLKDEYQDDIKHFVDHPDQKIPQGESLNQFRQRIRPIFGKAIQARKQGKPWLLLGHASVIREASNVFNAKPDTALVHPGGAVAVMHTPDGIRSVPIFKPDPDKADRFS
jgi:broad specificity phosphatase PhoE